MDALAGSSDQDYVKLTFEGAIKRERDSFKAAWRYAMRLWPGLSTW